MKFLAHRIQRVKLLTALACATGLLHPSARTQAFANDPAIDLSTLSSASKFSRNGFILARRATKRFCL